MSVYNLYFMNGRGHIDRIKHLEASSDEAVIDLARQDQGRQPIEIWCDHRKVHRIEAVAENEPRGKRVLEQLSRQQTA